MGEAYLAEQTAPVRRKVALKIIKLGMDSKQKLLRDSKRTAGAGGDGSSEHRQSFEAGTTDKVAHIL